MRITANYRVTAADLESRTIAGRVVPFGAVGHTSAGPTTVVAGAVTVPDRVPMLVSHDDDRPVGRMTSHDADDHGITASFRIIGTAAGDTALLEAAEGVRDGLSVGLDVTESHTDDGGALVVTAATLREVSLVTFPAFTDARVSDVAAHHDNHPHPHPHPDATPQPPAPKGTKRKDTTVDDTTTTAAVEASTAPTEMAETITAAHIPARVTAEAFPYGTPSASGLSMFRDLLEASHDPSAGERSRKAAAMLTAAATRPDIGEIIPPGYRPDMYVGEVPWGSPFRSAFPRHAITDATPFKIPTFATESGLVGDHVEGVNPTPGSLTFGEITVAPKAISGSYVVSREALDSANPALDSIILVALREAYDNHAENLVRAAVEAGATPGTAWPTADHTAALVAAMADFIATRMAEADTVLVKPSAFTQLATEKDSSKRPMNPYLNPSNADGTMGAAAGRLNVAGIAVRSAWSADADVIVAKRSDVAVFESAMLGFRFSEKYGPSAIEFASFGYVGAAVLRPTGVVTLTTAV